MKLIFASVAAAAIVIAAPAHAGVISTITYDPTNPLQTNQSTSVDWNISVTADPGYFGAQLWSGFINVDWGDGTPIDQVQIANGPPGMFVPFSHAYSAAGTYTQILSGNHNDQVVIGEAPITECNFFHCFVVGYEPIYGGWWRRRQKTGAG